MRGTPKAVPLHATYTEQVIPTICETICKRGAVPNVWHLSTWIACMCTIVGLSCNTAACLPYCLLQAFKEFFARQGITAEQLLGPANRAALISVRLLMCTQSRLLTIRARQRVHADAHMPAAPAAPLRNTRLLRPARNHVQGACPRSWSNASDRPLAPCGRQAEHDVAAPHMHACMQVLQLHVVPSMALLFSALPMPPQSLSTAMAVSTSLQDGTLSIIRCGTCTHGPCRYTTQAYPASQAICTCIGPRSSALQWGSTHPSQFLRRRVVAWMDGRDRLERR